MTLMVTRSVQFTPCNHRIGCIGYNYTSRAESGLGNYHGLCPSNRSVCRAVHARHVAKGHPKMQDTATLSPEILSPKIASVEESPFPWHVLRCRPLYAAALVDRLRALDLAYFQPLRSLVKIYKDRRTGKDIRRNFTAPIFAGYVFMSSTVDGLYLALSTHKVLGVISVKDQALFRREIGSFERALMENPRLGGKTEPTVGDRCTIVSGPYQGMAGILEKTGKAYVTLSITVMNQSIPIEVDPSIVEVA